MKKRTVLLVFTLLISLSTFAQRQNNKVVKSETSQSTRFNFERIIQLNKHKKNEEIIIKIEKQTKRFELMIQTSVSSGKLTIEIYDSNGERQGIFSVGTQLNIQNSEHAQGSINKFLQEPQPGNWKVKIIPVNAKGAIQIKTTTLF